MKCTEPENWDETSCHDAWQKTSQDILHEQEIFACLDIYRPGPGGIKGGRLLERFGVMFHSVSFNLFIQEK